MERVKVLIVDDEVEICKVLKLCLEETGKFDVMTATTGIMGLDLAKNEKPDIILLDIIMPGLTGDDVAERLFADKDTENIPIVFLTALLRKSEEKKFGANLTKYHLIAKPVKVDDLIAKIESVLEEKRKKT